MFSKLVLPGEGYKGLRLTCRDAGRLSPKFHAYTALFKLRRIMFDTLNPAHQDEERSLAGPAIIDARKAKEVIHILLWRPHPYNGQR